MVKLIDEAQRVPAQARPSIIIQTCGLFAVDTDRAVKTALLQPDRLQQRRLAGP